MSRTHIIILHSSCCRRNKRLYILDELANSVVAYLATSPICFSIRKHIGVIYRCRLCLLWYQVILNIASKRWIEFTGHDLLASLDFENKYQFLSHHGFNRGLGLEHFEAMLAIFDSLSGVVQQQQKHLLLYTQVVYKISLENTLHKLVLE